MVELERLSGFGTRINYSQYSEEDKNKNIFVSNVKFFLLFKPWLTMDAIVL